jgi:hypothetical protein
MLRAFATLLAAAAVTACGSTAASQNVAPPTTKSSAFSSATATPSTTPVPTATVAATAQALPTQATAPAPTAANTTCVSSAKGTLMAGQALLVDVRVGSHDGYDRVVLEFTSRQAPTNEASTFEIAPAAPPFVQDASGLPMTISGNPVLGIVLRGATAATLDGRSAYTGSRDFITRFPALNEFKSRGDFEAVSSWLAGMNGSGCVKAQVLTAPTRLVLDFAHR